MRRYGARRELRDILEPWSEEWKRAKMRALNEEYDGCEACQLCEFRNQVVHGHGSLEANFMFIGEAPGEQEDEDGQPFVGRSGEVLRELINATGIGVENVYLTNTVLCRPPDNRDPNSDEKKACFDRLREEIYIIDPLLIIAAGKVAFKTLVGNRASSIAKQHGRLFDCKIPGIKFELRYDLIPIYHPAYILRYDSRNKTDGTWKKGGHANETFDDLREALDLLMEVEELYENIRDKHRRKP